MPTAAGLVECKWTRNPGPPPTVTLTQVIIRGQRIGEGDTELNSGLDEWAAVFAALVGKRAIVDYSPGPPAIINSVKSAG